VSIPRVLSLGGGLDSFAMLVEAIRRNDRPDTVVFIDVGHPEDPGEWPGTYRHVHEVVRPLCAAHGIEFVIIDSTNYPVRDARSLFAWMQARRQIPVRGPDRICTTIAKVERFEAWARDRFGAGAEIEVWIGFERGEEKRAAKDPNAGTAKPKKGAIVRRNRFPLIEWELCRCRCESLVREAGLPVPRKSACMGCCYNTRADWQTLAREAPEVFARFVKLEADKPPTAAGARMTIASFTSRKDEPGPRATGWYPSRDGSGRWFKSKALPTYIEEPDRSEPPGPCAVCGAPVKATKAVGCGYLDDNDNDDTEAQ
jgi:hypothetical protein